MWFRPSFALSHIKHLMIDNPTLVNLSQALHNRQCSSYELTQYYLARIQQLNPTLNAFITVNTELALKQAGHADTLLDQGLGTRLTGLPIAHKDLFCTQGVRTSCGSRMLDNFTPPYDATLVHNLQQAGTVMLGKLNMDEFAMGSSNETSYYGTTRNPWDTSRTPGGSSGGSAACIAAQLAAGVTASDTGGSIRQPAAFCGVTGIKPTYSRVSRYGMIAYASSLDQAGVMARTAEDAAWLLQAMAGHDPKDATSSKVAVPSYSCHLNQPLTGLTIGLPEPYFKHDFSTAMHNAFETTRHTLERLGAQCKAVHLKQTDLATQCYYVLSSAECASNLSRYDGVRYGYRAPSTDLDTLYLKSRSEGFGPEVQSRILMGTYVLSAEYHQAYYQQAQCIRRLICDAFTETLQQVDLLLAPVTPTPAFPLGHHKKDPVAMALEDVFTVGVNLAGLPAITFPIGFDQGLPLGIQCIGRHFDESTLLRVAHQFQQHSDHHLKIPKLL